MVSPRHLLPYLVLGICWAGVGAVNFGRWYSRTVQDGAVVGDFVRRGITIALIFAALFQLKPNADFVQAAFNGEIPTEEKQAGQWLGRRVEPGDLVMERKAVVAFYAGLRRLEIPHVSLDRVIEYARMHDADYLVASSRHVPVYRPQLKPLLGDEPIWEPDLKLIHEQHNRHNDEMFVRIFEVQPTDEDPPAEVSPG
jgi:hypothetical protein